MGPADALSQRDHLDTTEDNANTSILPDPMVINVAHALPAMVFFFLFLFVPLFATLLLTVYITLCKPGYAVSAADMSSV